MGPRASGQNSGVRRGRCNVTHDVVTPEDFFGTRHLVRNVLAAFPYRTPSHGLHRSVSN